ncbi:MAG: protein kinase [Longimicrobiales bacterium]|nr:protein kinase [Longimicrobiales bacterium]
MADVLDRLKAALADRYALERELGAGGMATVYLATDLKHDRPVALKVLRPDLAASLGTERFLAEIRLTARLQHPHIVALFDSGEAAGFLYYVMPCIEGESLRARLDREKRLDLEAMLAIARPVAQALAYAHELGIVHRDIKPENILFSRGQPFVTDFGVARAVSVAGGAHLTGTGVVVGTPAYMSPEQVLGDEGVDARSDVYSLGCVIYEMLAGTPPFTARTLHALLARRLTGPPPHLSGVPAPVDEVVLKSLATAPQDRFATAIALADALVEAARRPATPELSIVVLPFENLSPDPDNAFFADGLTEELIADLSKVRALRVISRTSAMHYKGTTKALPDIARELNARYVLEGSVRRAGNSLRITAQLIDAKTDAHLWAEKYAGTLEDVFELQERLSRRIVEALAVTLTREEERQLATRPIPDEQAYALYLRARQEIWRMDPGPMEVALHLVEAALERTGPNALLLATEAEIYYMLAEVNVRPVPETLERAGRLVAEALALAPDLADAHAVKGAVAFRGGDILAALVSFRRAVELAPANVAVRCYLAWALAEAGYTEEARRHADAALALDPLPGIGLQAKAYVEFLDGRFDAAPAIAHQWWQLAGEPFMFRWFLGLFLLYAGRRAEAEAQLQCVTASQLEGGPRILSAYRAQLEALLTGNATALRRELADEEVERTFRLDKQLAFSSAAAFAACGSAEESLSWLASAIDRGFINRRFFAEHDPFLARLRGDPRFEALMDRASAKQQELEATA